MPWVFTVLVMNKACFMFISVFVSIMWLSPAICPCASTKKKRRMDRAEGGKSISKWKTTLSHSFAAVLSCSSFILSSRFLQDRKWPSQMASIFSRSSFMFFGHQLFNCSMTNLRLFFVRSPSKCFRRERTLIDRDAFPISEHPIAEKNPSNRILG